MDKNMMNIDDLFRQRLGGGEEEEQSGAWLNMRELLDREIPTKIAGGMGWRRMLSYTAGLVLLAGVSLGGYELSSSTRNIGGSERHVMVAKAADMDNNASNSSSYNSTKINTNKNSSNNTNSLYNPESNSSSDNSNTLALAERKNNSNNSQLSNNTPKINSLTGNNSTKTTPTETANSA